MPDAYTGYLIDVDLEAQTTARLKLDEQEVAAYLLGSGWAALAFWRALKAGKIPDDPLDPASPLYVLTGLLTGSIAPTGCRTSWCARSPLTGIWGESNMGGHWGAGLRHAGYDGLLLRGGAPHPVYLWIDGPRDVVELRDARHLWGLDGYATHARICDETAPRVRVACIGPAGERGVRYAAIMQGGASLT